MRNPESIFVDTWGWLSLGHRRDSHHEEVKRIYQGLRQRRIPIYTSDYVLDEVINLSFQRVIIIGMAILWGFLGSQLGKFLGRAIEERKHRTQRNADEENG